MYTRILSVFNFLKRVGFAVLLLGVQIFAHGQDWIPMRGMSERFNEMKQLGQSDTLLVLVQSGDLYMSGNFGLSWQPILRPNATISSIEIRHFNAQTQLLICCSQAPYLRYSTDFGANWQALAAGLPEARGGRIEIDALERMWVYGRQRLYYSEPGSSIFDSAAVPAGITEVWDVAFSDANTLWIACEEDGAYHSTNLGQSWLQVYPSGDEDIRGIEINPEDHSIAILLGSTRFWRANSAGQYEALTFPWDGLGYASMLYLNGDSTQMIACRGFTFVVNNVYRSNDAGQTWQEERCGELAASGWRMQRLSAPEQSVAIVLSSGALLSTDECVTFDYTWEGKDDGGYLLSRHVPGLIVGNTINMGIFISSDSGQSWQSTPFHWGFNAVAEHPLRTSFYIFRDGETCFQLHWPSMQIDSLGEIDNELVHSVFVSDADTNLLYAASFSDSVYRSDDGGRHWIRIANPAAAEVIVGIVPSRVEPDVAYLHTRPFATPRIWRTENRGETWQLIHQANVAMQDWMGVVWIPDDGSDELNFVVDGAPPQTWYFYSQDGGQTFDSVQTSGEDWGFSVYEWGDSIYGIKRGNPADSIFLAEDHCSAYRFVTEFPEGVQSTSISASGRFGQLIHVDHLQGGSRYFRWNPLSVDDDRPHLPESFALAVFPNPFNSTTRITLSLPPHIHHAELRVHNLLGQEVLLRELHAENGQAEFALDGTNLATGVYLVSARAGESIATQKVMLLK